MVAGRSEHTGWHRRPLSRDICTLAAAMAGNPAALTRVVEEPAFTERIARQRIAALLARRAREAHVSGPAVESWQAARRAIAASWLLAEHMLGIVGESLAAAAVRWSPIKGADLAFRVHQAPEDRPATDLDILVAPADLATAVAALKEAGWSDRWSGDPGMWRYALDEGHNWPLVRREGVMVEVHFRLWGWLPPELAPAMLARAQADPSRGLTACRLLPADAALLSACHAWTEALGEAPLRTLYDVCRLLTVTPGLDAQAAADTLVAYAAKSGLQAAVGGVLRLVIALWPETPAEQLASRMIHSAPRLERAGSHILWPRIGHRNALAALVLLRLLARQPSRQGWKSLGRRLLPHEGFRHHRPGEPLA